MTTKECDKQDSATPKYVHRDENETLNIQIALPGVKKSDVDLTIEDGVLVLQAQRESVEQENWTVISSFSAPKNYNLRLKIAAIYDLEKSEVNFNQNILNIIVPHKVKELITLDVF